MTGSAECATAGAQAAGPIVPGTQETPQTQPAEPLDVAAERKRMSRIGTALLLLLVITSVLQAAISYGAAVFAPAWATQPWYFWVLTMAPMYLVGAPVCILLLCHIPAERWEGAVLQPGRFFFFFVISIGLLYIGSLLGTGVNALISALRGSPVQNALETIVMGSDLLYTALFAVLVGPLVEELIFRKLLIDRLHRYGDRAAILMSALLFGMLHGNFSQFFYAFALGVLFGYVYVRTRRLRYSVLLHMAINFLGSVVSVWLAGDVDASGDISGLAATLSPKLLLTGLYGLLMIGCSIAGIVLLLQNRKKAVLSEGTCPLPKAVRGQVLFVNTGILLYLAFCAVLFIASALI